MFRIEHNVDTGEIKQIDLTPEEIASIEAKQAEQAAANAAAAQAEADKATAKAALLTKLGITEEEAKLLLS
jgi:regulator of protease activity HflC (stomatin/prohibitin superfamily)